MHLKRTYVKILFHQKLLGMKEKTNRWNACKLCCMLNGYLMHNITRLIISSTELQQSVIYDFYVELGNDLKTKAMSSLRGRDAT